MKKLAFVVFLFLSISSFASNFDDSMSIVRFNEEIDNEQLYISENVSGVDTNFLKKIDYFQYNFQLRNYPLSSKRKHFANLYNFLHVISTSVDAKEKFKQGFYQEALDFFPSIIAYSESGDLQKLLSAYPAKTLKSIPILFNEIALKNVLNEIAFKDPEVFYKYIYELFTLPYCRKLVEEVAIFAPVTAKKYLFTSNYVSYYLESSQLPEIRKLYEIKANYNAAAKCFILLNDLMDNTVSIQNAENYCQFKEMLIKNLLQTIQREGHLADYSINKELENLSVFTIRDFKLNGSPAIAHLSKKELIMTMIYGNKELSAETLRFLISAVSFKKNELITVENIQNIHVKYLASFVNVIDQLGQGDFLNRTFSDEARDFVMSKMNFEEESKYSLKNHDLLQLPDGWANPEIDMLTMEQKEELSLAKKELNSLEEVNIGRVKTIEYDFPKIGLDEKDKLLLSWTKNLNQSIKDIPDIIEQENGTLFLDYLSKNHPDEIFACINDIFGKSYCMKYISQAAIAAPNSAKRYLYNPQNKVYTQLAYSKNEEIKTLFQIFQKYSLQSKSYFLVNEIYKNKESIESIHESSKDKIQFLKKLCKIAMEEDAFGKYSVAKELNYEALRIVRDINGSETQGEAKFNIVQQLNAQEIYALMVYGKEELFKNSFNSIYNIFKIKLNNTNAVQFFESVNYHKFRSFLSLCSTFDKWSDFFAGLTFQERQVVYLKMFANLENENDYLNESIELADILQNIKDQPTKVFLHEQLKKEFETADKSGIKKRIAILGLMSSIISDYAVADHFWYKSISKAYKLPPLNTLYLKDLIGKNGKVTENCYFYDDEDGRSSYLNFIAGYKNQVDWSFEDYSTYIKISSRSGTPIEIYANKPEAEFVGQQAINAIFKESYVEPSIIIHRGHSYHTEKTIKQISNSPKFIFLGSCGGYYKISDALEKAPNALTLATKQIGTKSVNDPIFRTFNEDLRKGLNINWKTFWDNIELKLGNNPLFYDYVPPHKNIGTLFIRAYYYLVGI